MHPSAGVGETFASHGTLPLSDGKPHSVQEEEEETKSSKGLEWLLVDNWQDIDRPGCILPVCS